VEKLECGLLTISTDIGKMAHILCILDEVCNYNIQTLYCDTCRPQDTVPSKRASKKKITLFCGNLRFSLRNEKTCFFIGKCVFLNTKIQIQCQIEILNIKFYFLKKRGKKIKGKKH